MIRACLSSLAALLLASPWALAAEGGKIRVLTTSSSYAPIVRYIGGDKVEVEYIVKGYQDPHIVRPKPSLAVDLAKTDLLIATGLDLEAWLPTLQDMSGNPAIMSGQKGYVSVAAGLKIAEKPTSLDRSEGDVHIFGNPHIHTSPLNGKVIAENITIGLKKVLPQHAALFEANLKKFDAEIDRRLFGEQLVKLLGGKTLCRLAEKGQLYAFLEKKKFKGKPLTDFLGGWMKKALPLRGKKIVTYHKNWTYFSQLFGIEVVGYMEPKPGIPPTPGHISSLIDRMRREKITVVLAANYFDIGKVERVTEMTGAKPVVVALSVDGQPEMKTFFDQFDIWLDALNAAFASSGS
ncbi:MAG: zinc ABC transporter substrate-binding protein [Deltaproteobacteria bacterium]|nr:zinc ABC transporter substrate-binding protein [Deltaproteobacteria bacterium]